MSTPRLFVSYCWSTPDHEEWVVDLATELTNSGVEVILDKWDLREGHDSVAFMEKMVTDETINKVIMVCDRAYADRADGRKGGVGTETQIISREVYERTDQNKFVAVLAERDEAGKPFLPTYYKSRIYIDLSHSEKYAEGFEALVRWVFDKPIRVRPQLGKPPSFVTEADQPALGTSSLARRAMDAIRNDKGYARGALDEYLATFASNMERFRVKTTAEHLEEAVVSAIDAFTLPRSEFLQVVGAYLQYAQPGSTAKAVHNFFESTLAYYTPPEGSQSAFDGEFDNFKFVLQELFLYTQASYLRAEDYAASKYLLSQPYYISKNLELSRNPSATFAAINAQVPTLVRRNQRLNLNRLSLHADMLEKRSRAAGMPFRNVMQADFVCFLRGALKGTRWHPETLLYATNQYGPFELFSRASSKTTLSEVLAVLGVSGTAPIKALLDDYASGRRNLPRWQFDSFDPGVLMDFENLGTKD